MSLIIGDGYYGVVNIIGGTAHNDFLEVFFDFGIIGFIVYLNIYINLFKKYYYMRKSNYKYSSQYLVSIISFLVMSMFSHVIMIPTYMMFICLYWGLIENDYKLIEEKNKDENCNNYIS